jgi:TPR repeat protein
MSAMSANKRKKSSWFVRGHRAWGRRDLGVALRLFLQGARRKDASCQQNVGYFYDEGVGVAPNLRKAEWWYAKSARGGSSSGAYNLGLLHTGKKRFALAKKWFKTALKLGDTDARLRITELEKKQLKLRRRRSR